MRGALDQVAVTILGGGVVGTACALELARRGARVRVLERDGIGRACSYGNAGWLTPSLAFPLAAPGQIKKALGWMLDRESPFRIQLRADPKLIAWLFGFWRASRRGPFERGAARLVELSRWSVDAWERLAKETPSFEFERSGLVTVYESDAALAQAQEAARLVEGFGIESEHWSPAELAEREPSVVVERTVGALYFPRDARCEPFLAVQALQSLATRAGVEFVEGIEVLDIERRGGRVESLVTTQGRRSVEDSQVVLAAGSWSAELGRSLGLKLPMLGAKGYSVLWPRSVQHPGSALYLAERKVAINPHAQRLRVSGTLELVQGDLSIDRRRVNAMLRGARELLHVDEGASELELWRGLRPCTPDGMPVIGRAGGSENLWLATGHQMTGLKTAPGTAQLLADLMEGSPPTFAPHPFRAERYARLPGFKSS